MNKETTKEYYYATVSVLMTATTPLKRELKKVTKKIKYNSVNERHSRIYEIRLCADYTPLDFADFAMNLILMSYSGFLNHVIEAFPQQYAEAKGEETEQPYISYSLALAEPTAMQDLDKHEVKFDETLRIDESTFVDNFNNIDKEAIRSALVDYAKKYIFPD